MSMLQKPNVEQARPDPVARDQKPPTEIESKLLQIWRQVLDRESVGIHEDFSGLGGDSLAALVLTTEIESVFGVSLQLTDILEHSTIAKQAHTILERKSSDVATLGSQIVVGRATGAQPPLFVVHGAWGFSFLKRTFLEEIGHERPIFSFQAPGFDGKTTPLTSITELAGLYVSTLRSIHPDGPYNLVALCAGALIALEMANQIEAEGHKVGRLIFLDPPERSMSGSEPMVKGIFKFGPQQREQIRNRMRAFGRSPAKAVTALKRRLVRPQTDSAASVRPANLQDLRIRMQARRLRSADWIDETADLPEAMVRTVDELRRALKRHIPQYYPGTAVMLLTNGRQAIGPNSFWRSHLRGIDYQLRDWDHKDVFGVHLSETARFVRDALEVPWDPRLMPGLSVGSI
jgi:thioesterase domain-containing protein/acyl carrier protein